MVKYRLFRIAAFLVPLAPIWLSWPLAVAVGALLWLVAGDSRRRVERNLRHIPALSNDPARLSRAARGVFQHMALNYLDFFRGPSISDAELMAGWDIENQSGFDEAMARGKGMIILAGHFGNFERGSARLGVLGHHLMAPVEHMEPEPLFQFFCQIRQHHNLRVVAADSRESLRDLMDALKRGEIVIFLADRHILGASATVSFFGEPAQLPTGPVALALRSQAPVMGVYCWREGRNHSRGVFAPLAIGAENDPISSSTERSSAAVAGAVATKRSRVQIAEDIQRALQQFVAQLEQQVAAHPEQWVSTLSPIWDD